MLTHFAKFGLLFFLAIGGANAQAQTTETQVDFNKVNNVIQEVIDSSVVTDDVIKSVALIISPASNVSEGKFAAQFTSVFGTAPWAVNQDGQLNFAFGTRFSDVNAGYKNADFKIKAEVKTPVLNMIRYFSSKSLESKPSDDTTFEAVTTRKLAVVKNLNELLNIALSIRDYYLENGNEDVKEFLKNIQVTTKMVDGNITSFKVQGTKPIILDFFEQIEIKIPTVTVNANSISGSLTVGILVKEADFNDYVSRINELLLKLQERNQQTLEQLKRDLNEWSGIVRDFLTK